ncbi:MAG TPA: hypothetical protein VMM18_00055 [Gemmatimonadaceae bacterium]|nr:hypothetical protein [Gemmatimonadaceae bacterium]
MIARRQGANPTSVRPAVRRPGRRLLRLVLPAVVAVMLAPSAEAQRVTAGAHYALAQYAEQGASLRFAGGGPAAQASVQWRRFGLHVAAARLSFEPHDGNVQAEGFNATQRDLRLRVRATPLVSVEAGFVDRDVEPLHAAQSFASLRLGALVAFPLHIGSELAVRAAYLGGSRFSGGGSAPFGVEIGMHVGYAPWSDRLRFTGDLEFQRLDRRTETGGGELAAPIQSAIARVGFMVAW